MFFTFWAPVQRVRRVQRGGPKAFWHPLLGAALLAAAWSGPAWANPEPEQQWRAANELVGAFPRGHADIVQWEAQQQPHASAAPQPAAAQHLRLSDALMAAQRARPDLLARPGPVAPANRGVHAVPPSEHQTGASAGRRRVAARRWRAAAAGPPTARCRRGRGGKRRPARWPRATAAPARDWPRQGQTKRPPAAPHPTGDAKRLSARRAAHAARAALGPKK